MDLQFAMRYFIYFVLTVILLSILAVPLASLYLKRRRRREGPGAINEVAAPLPVDPTHKNERQRRRAA